MASMVINLCLSGGMMLSALEMGVFRIGSRIFEPRDPYFCSAREEIEKMVNDVKTRMGIKKDVKVIQSYSGNAQAKGNSFLPGSPAILVNSDFYSSLEDNQKEFLIAHELAHIKKNDCITMPLIAGLIGVVVMVALSLLFPPLSVGYLFSAAAIIGYATSFLALFTISYFREKAADKLAFEHCSEEGKRGGIELFESLREDAIEKRNEDDVGILTRIWRKIKISPEGNNRLDLFHPSFTARIKYLTELNDQYQSKKPVTFPELGPFSLTRKKSAA